MLRSCDNRGFQIEFSNGYTVSCQFGTTNYCSRRSFDLDKILSERNQHAVSSEDCEVAVITKKGEFVTGEVFKAMKVDISNDGMVAGWVSADDVGKIIAYVKDMEVRK